MEASIFDQVLESMSPDLPLSVREHFQLKPSDPYEFILHGEMEEIWHRPKFIKPFLWLLSKMDTFFPETGSRIPVQLENTAYIDLNNESCMEWKRTFFFSKKKRYFVAVMKYDHTRKAVIDYFGKNQEIEVVLRFEPFTNKQGKGLKITSDTYFYRLGKRRIQLPAWLIPKATIYEWASENSQDEIFIDVRVHHPIVGDFFGYYGSFTMRRVPK